MLASGAFEDDLLTFNLSYFILFALQLKFHSVGLLDLLISQCQLSPSSLLLALPILEIMLDLVFLYFLLLNIFFYNSVDSFTTLFGVHGCLEHRPAESVV